MRKLLCLTLFVLTSLVCFSQEYGPFKFLGIPVDGPQAQFVSQLKAKGFVYNSFYERYEGQFNGKNVDVLIHTNHNLVDRVMVMFPATSEREIRNEFNRLLSQFNENAKYMDLDFNEEIPSDENISYEIMVNNKRYQASFYYFDQDRDVTEFSNALVDKLSGFLTAEEANRVRESNASFLELSEDERGEVVDKMAAELGQSMANLDEESQLRYFLGYLEALQSLADGNVWFMISESGAQYQILLFYDNPRNQAHGEDL